MKFVAAFGTSIGAGAEVVAARVADLFSATGAAAVGAPQGQRGRERQQQRERPVGDGDRADRLRRYASGTDAGPGEAERAAGVGGGVIDEGGRGRLGEVMPAVAAGPERDVGAADAVEQETAAV